MMKVLWKEYGYSSLLMALVAFIAWKSSARFSIGVLLGILSYGMYLVVLSRSATALLQGGQIGLYHLAYGLKLLVLLIPFLFSVLYPEKIHFLGVLLVLFVNKAVLFLPHLFNRRGRNEY